MYHMDAVTGVNELGMIFMKVIQQTEFKNLTSLKVFNEEFILIFTSSHVYMEKYPF